MSSNDRRVRARRRAWGHGPMILRFEPLEGRQLLSANDPLATLAALASGVTTTTPVAEKTTPITNPATTSTSAAAAPASSSTTAATSPAKLTSPAPIIAASQVDQSNLITTAIGTPHNLDWGDSFHATGSIQNNGAGPSLSASKINL